MLIEFKVVNYRSFRDEAILSMEATGIGAFNENLIKYNTTDNVNSKSTLKLLPSVAIYGKNGGGKSNVIRAFWLAVQFICNAQRTQHEKAPVPVYPFLLDDEAKEKPTEFEFAYVHNGIRYYYGFSAKKEAITRESLYYAPNGRKALVFSRTGQIFKFNKDNEPRKCQMISETVAPNQLYFAVACAMNEKICIDAMSWFREHIFFSRDYTDIPEAALFRYSEDANMINAISNYAKMADVGIHEMRFEVKNTELMDTQDFPDDLPEEIKTALAMFMSALTDAPNVSEHKLKMGEVNAIAYHQGINRNGEAALYELELADESDGTRKLMALAPAIERALNCGGLLLVDELEKEIHPMLVEMIISKFQSPKTNPNHAQLIFTTHNTELLNMKYLRKDQLYFVDKSSKDGVSSLYSISEYSPITSENVRKSYLIGKYGAIPNLPVEEVD